MVTKYADHLILDIGGCVCGTSSCTLKVVPQDSISSRDTKVEQSTKVAMVCACCWYTFHICATTTMTTESNVLPTTQHNYLCNRAEFLSVVWEVFLAPSLSWINTLSHLPLILSTKASQIAVTSLWYSLAAWRSHTSYIFLKLVNAVSTSTSLPFHTSMLLEKSIQGRQYPPFSCQL